MALDDVVASDRLVVVELAAFETLPKELDSVLGRYVALVALTTGVIDVVVLAAWDVDKIRVILVVIVIALVDVIVVA